MKTFHNEANTPLIMKKKSLNAIARILVDKSRGAVNVSLYYGTGLLGFSSLNQHV